MDSNKKRKLTKTAPIENYSKPSCKKHKKDTKLSEKIDAVDNSNPQLAQICAWCCTRLYLHQETTIYSGDDPSYKNWMVHLDCDLTFNHV